MEADGKKLKFGVDFSIQKRILELRSDQLKFLPERGFCQVTEVSTLTGNRRLNG